MGYLTLLAGIIAIYIVLTQSLDLLVGRAGVLSLCHAAFFGIGAYGYVIAEAHLGLGFVASGTIAVLAAACLSLLVVLATWPLPDEHFALATFGVQLSFLALAANWLQVTGGPLGLAVSRTTRVGPWTIDSDSERTALAVLLAVGVVVILGFVVRSPFGRLLMGARDDPLLIAALGRNPRRVRAVAVAMSGSVAGIAGAMYALQVGYVSPSAFSIMESIMVLSMVIIGGRATLVGPLLGVSVVIGVPELLRFFAPLVAVGPVRQIVFGGALVLAILFRPEGLAGRARGTEVPR